MPGVLRAEMQPSPSLSNMEASSGSSSPRSSDNLGAANPAAGRRVIEGPLDEELEPIAVIGMGCRLPGDVSTATEFWDMMMSKKSGQTPKVPANRFNIDAHYHKNRERPGSFPVLGGYFIKDDLEAFDPGVFSISPVEAMWMDPQQRKLLEVVYEAFESGGVSLEKIAGSRTGVFAASFTSDWQQMAFKEPSFRHTMAATGVDPGILSDRISYVFNLNGPSVLCNTACSSSIYALHNACIALRHRECEGAIVGGTNLVFTVDQQMNTAKIGVLSPRSTCFTFDDSADGYGRAEGVGAVYLKRLSDAVRDGDPVRAVIRSSAVNHNGKAHAASISYPGKDGQAHVMFEAYKRAGNLDPLQTGYFETHGTGTSVGDPIEAEAISIAMNYNRRPGIDDPLMIGAVKTNIGHGEAASGLSALIKAVLIVERGIIPPTIGISKLSSKIKWDEWQVQVPTEPTPFPSHLPVRRVSVNTCGYGGTNAHVIVEEAASFLDKTPNYKYIDNSIGRRRGVLSRQSGRGRGPAALRKRPFLLPFSANDKATLRRNIEAHGKVAESYSLLDLSYTLCNRRTIHACKGFSVASHKTLRDAFSDIDGASTSFSLMDKKKEPPTAIGFVFTGQGAQWARMGAEVMEYSPRFLSTIRALDRAFDALPDGPEWSIEDVLLESESTSPVNQAEFSQPLCTAVQIALVDVLADWGIRPTVTVGHSSGEMAAAYAAGLISAEEAITAAYYRGVVTMDVQEGGAMMAVGLSAEGAEKHIAKLKQGKVIVACHNSPAGVTLSGDASALEELKVKFDVDNIFARLVKTNGKAYHSHYMAPVAQTYQSMFEEARATSSFPQPQHQSAGAKMVSSVTNSVLSDSAQLDGNYWTANLTSPVLFNQAVQTMLTSDGFPPVELLIEVGPHSAMAGPIQQIKTALQVERLEYLPSLLRGTDSAVQLLKLAGEMFLRSYSLNMEAVASAFVPEREEKGSVIVDLPRYQWNYGRHFWPENRASREHRRATHARHDLLGQKVLGASLAEPTWRNVLRIRDVPWLRDHSLGGEAVFPAAGYFSMAIEAITQLHERTSARLMAGSSSSNNNNGTNDAVGDKIDSYTLRDVSINKALVTPDDDDGIEVLTNLRPSLYGAGWWDFSVSSVDADSTEKEHMAGSIGINKAPPRGFRKPREAPDFPQRASGRAWNEALRDVGFDYGPTFQDMDDIRFDGRQYAAGCATAVSQSVDEAMGESRYVLHPASVDSVLQLSIAAIHAGRTSAMEHGVVPVQVDEVNIWRPTDAQLAARSASALAWVPRRGVRSFEGSAEMTAAADGELVLEIVNIRTTSYEAAVPQTDLSRALQKKAPFGEMAWELDIDALDQTEGSGLSGPDMARLCLFKHPDLEVVHVATDDTCLESASSILRSNTNALFTLALDAVQFDEDEVAMARESISEYPNAKLATLDILKGLESQSFAPASCGVLVAAAHLVPKLRGLVRPGGYIISNDSPAAVSMVPAAEDAESASRKSAEEPYRVHLIYRGRQLPIVSDVQKALQSLGWHVAISNLESCDKPGSTAGHVVMLTDFGGSDPLLFSVTEKEFAAVQNITNSVSHLLWVTDGGLLDGKRPQHALVSGLARVVTSEQATLDFRTLDVDTDVVPTAQVVKSIVRAAHLQLDESGGRGMKKPEREFCISHGGQTYISRLVRNTRLNDMYTTSGRAEPTTSLSPQDHISSRVVQGKVVFERLDEKVKAAEAEVQPGHVEVQVQCSGLTKEGVLVITGSDNPTTFSHEIGGVVKQVGDGVLSLRPGDRVVGFNVDNFASHQHVSADLLHRLQPEDDMGEAVSLLMAYGTAMYGLETLAMLQPGETVLVLHNTGAYDTAAVRVTQAKGATPYVEVRTEEEAIFLQEHLCLPRENIICVYGDGQVPTVASALSQLTKGRGADVVFSTGTSVEASSAREAWRGIARFGRFVDAGRKDVLSRSAIDSLPLRGGALYLPFDMLDLLEARPDRVAALLPGIVDMYQRGQSAVPGMLRRSPLAGLNQAVAAFSDAFGTPKPTIYHEASDDSPLDLVPASAGGRVRFRRDATYLLVGCLGGLGRSLTRWMLEKGAGRFAFLSRSGVDAPSSAKLVADIEAAGAVVQVIRGDVTNREDVVRAVKSVSQAHPVRGVVHAAMVLRDGLFYDMCFANWKASLAPKVLGAMNLHSVFSDSEAAAPLDFFLMTSSVSGILGTLAQSNYAAANSYLDALARHRMRQSGLAATACVIPMVLGVGVVAENAGLEESLRRKGMYGIDDEHLLQSLEAGILARERSGADHVVIGLDPALLHKAVAAAQETDGAGTADSFWVKDARFSRVVFDMAAGEMGAGGSGVVGGGVDVLAAVRAASSAAEAAAIVESHFAEKLVRMLMLATDEVDPDHGSIASYGIDSMIGAELRNWIFTEFRIDIPFQQLLAPTLTVAKFAAQVCATQGFEV